MNIDTDKEFSFAYEISFTDEDGKNRSFKLPKDTDIVIEGYTGGKLRTTIKNNRLLGLQKIRGGSYPIIEAQILFSEDGEGIKAVQTFKIPGLGLDENISSVSNPKPELQVVYAEKGLPKNIESIHYLNKKGKIIKIKL